MRFVLTDRISELEPGKRIVAHKAVSLAEEYLADHFPSFPVLPGVLMLEALVQASAWLARVSLDFAPALVVLKEARNFTYKSFAAPGRVLAVESVCRELGDGQSEYVGTGQLDGREVVKGRLVLRHLNLADSDPELAGLDARLRADARGLFARLLVRPAANPAPV